MFDEHEPGSGEPSGTDGGVLQFARSLSGVPYRWQPLAAHPPARVAADDAQKLAALLTALDTLHERDGTVVTGVADVGQQSVRLFWDDDAGGHAGVIE